MSGSGSECQLYVFGACRRSAFVVGPKVSDFDSVFGELAADVKVPGNFIRATAGKHQTSQRRIGHQRGRTDSVGGLFVRAIPLIVPLPHQNQPPKVLRISPTQTDRAVDRRQRPRNHASPTRAAQTVFAFPWEAGSDSSLADYNRNILSAAARLARRRFDQFWSTAFRRL